MRKVMYQHQANELAERTVDDFTATLALGNVTTLRVKTNQWLTWSGVYDKGGAWSIRSLADVQALKKAVESNGIVFEPWAVPMGLDTSGGTAYDDATTNAEASFLATVGHTCGSLELDVEPYSEFWPALAASDYRAVEPLFRQLKSMLGEVPLRVDIPYRNTSWERAQLIPFVERARSYVDEWWLQSYFGYDQAYEAANALGALVGPEKVYHILSVDTLADLDQFAPEGSRDLGVWQAAGMTHELYAILANYQNEGNIPWQSPGFAAMAKSNKSMKLPISNPYADNLGNVFQDGPNGMAIWVKKWNRNYYLENK